MLAGTSPEVSKIFNSRSEIDQDSEVTLNEVIENIQAVSEQNNGCKDVVEGHDKENPCTGFQKYITRQKCVFLCQVYQHALVYMN